MFDNVRLGMGLDADWNEAKYRLGWDWMQTGMRPSMDWDGAGCRLE